MMGKFGLALAGALAIAVATPTVAAPVKDCPNRDAPFSVESPLLDLLLNSQAKAVLNEATGGRMDKLPPMFMGTTPPTFAAILTVTQAGRWTGMSADLLPGIDRKLRAIPVTAADKAARCARYDSNPVRDAVPLGAPRILLFEKINGFKDVPSVNAAHAAILDMAQRKGWAVVTTENGGAFTPANLRRFDLVIWNNISGDVLTVSQRRAMKGWIERGGGWLGMHGSAGDPVYFWDWYADGLIGARFAGHPMNPQFQDARVVVEASDHPVAKGLPKEWVMKDEWYSFKTSPRAAGARIVATLDESTYVRTGMGSEGLTMGADHPIAWTQCIGKGRMFYSAIGHMPETYVHPLYVTMLENAIPWAADRKAQGCGVAK